MAILLDVSGDNLTRTANHPALTALTMMGWFMRVVDRNANSAMLAFGDATGTGFVHHGTDSANDGFATYPGSSTVNGGGVVTIGQWFHLGLTCAGTGAGQLISYRDGVAVWSDTLAAVVSPEKMWIGDNPANQWFSGRAAAIKIYDAVLTANEMITEMRYYQPVRVANLNTWMPCIHPTGASNGVDFSGVGGNFTVGGTLTVADGPPIAWAPRRPQPMNAGAVAGIVRQMLMQGLYANP